MRRMRMKTIRTWLNALAIVFVLIPAWRAAAVDVPLRQWQASLSWSSGPRADQASPGIAPLALPSASAQLVAITPCRIIDTRPGYPAAYAPGTKLQVGVTVTFDMNSAPAPCNTIPSNAVAYSLNVVAVGPGAAGFLSVFPGATPPNPLTSLLNFAAGDVVANASVVPGDDNGLVGFLSAATTDLLVDINGYYAPAAAGGIGSSVIGGGSGANVSVSGPTYLPAFGFTTALTSSEVEMPLPVAGTLSNVRFRLSQLGYPASSFTFTVGKNGSFAGNPSCQILNVAQECTVTTGTTSLAFLAGDRISIQCTPGGGALSLKVSWSATFQ